MDNIPFIFKYIPKNLEDFMFTEDLNNILNLLLYMDNMNMLLIGNSGSGKTALIKILLHKYYKDPSLINNDNVLYINNLKEQGIQYYRNDVKTFCQTKSHVKKTIILDDIDLINEQSQQVFRNCIDKYGDSVNFLCSCRNTQKVIESIQSRIICITLKPLTYENMSKILYNIVKKENISIDTDACDFILAISENSARMMINYLEKLKLLDTHITKPLCCDVCTSISFDDFNKFTTLCKEANLSGALKIINNLSDTGFSVMDILDNYFQYIKYIENLSEKQKYEITKLIMKYISIFHNIHEDEIELTLFTNNLIILFS
jgi:DNA polymerase III delta prime subunit|tara:strand:- start:2626 stop:3576 length:951 start_codon:yes stop_codon:yes gene_type:complete